MTRRQRTSPRPMGKRVAWVVLGSATIHFLILAPLALGSSGLIPSRLAGTQPRWQQPIELVLIPAPGRLAPDQAETESGIPDQVQGTEGRRSDMVSRLPRDAAPIDVASRAPNVETGRLSAPVPSRGSQVERAADLSESWRAGAASLAAGPSRSSPDCLRPETLSTNERAQCRARTAIAGRNSAAPPIGARRLTDAEAQREARFAEQAESNETRAKYRRMEVEYPGLRSFMRNF